MSIWISISVHMDIHFCYQNIEMPDMDMCVNLFKSHSNKIISEKIFLFLKWMCSWFSVFVPTGV